MTPRVPLVIDGFKLDKYPKLDAIPDKVVVLDITLSKVLQRSVRDNDDVRTRYSRHTKIRVYITINEYNALQLHSISPKYDN